MYPATSNFRSAIFGDAWWVLTSMTSSGPQLQANYPSDSEFVAEYYGPALASSLQTIMKRVMPSSYTTFDGSLGPTVPTDGGWGDAMLRALWGYARLLMLEPAVAGDPQKTYRPTQPMLDAIAADARARRLSIETVRVAIWLAFYGDMLVPSTSVPGARMVTWSSETMQPFARIAVPSNAVLPVYGQIPVGATPGQFLYPITTDRQLLYRGGAAARELAPRPGFEIPGDESKGWDPYGVPDAPPAPPPIIPTWAIALGLVASAGAVYYFTRDRRK